MTIHFSLQDHVARITIDRPQVLNAIDRNAEEELQRIWREIENDDQVWCAVLTGGGEKAFCVGADVRAADESGQTGLQYWASPRPGGFGGIATRTTLTVPVIARVNGYALGGGFEMVLGCDIVIAANNAQFGLPEPRIGFMPLDGGMVQLPRQIGMKAAMGMLLTGRRISAAEALQLGLINEVTDMAELDQSVERWLQDILACSPLALKAIKYTVKKTAHLPVEEALGLRHTALMQALDCADREEGVRAFREKRAPDWQGC